MSYYIPSFLYKMKELIEEADPVYKEFLDVNSLILNQAPGVDDIVVPLKKGLKTIFKTLEEAAAYIDKEFKKSELYNLDLDLAHAIIDSKLYIHGEEYDQLSEEYTYDFIRTNICNFSLDWTDGRVKYRETPYSSKDDMKDTISYGCDDMVGSASERIADIFKLTEILLLHISGNLSKEESDKITSIIGNVNKEDLVVTKKYSSVSDFVQKFFDRQRVVRKIIDRKTAQYEEKEKNNEN